MPPFPAVDPIPLPAPIWLFKLLHIVTLSLHFVAVEMLLGGLLLAVVLSLFRGSSPAHVTARAIARRLTVVMTYVINLGVPPLLFAQVLYGRALYTSSILIGAYWISIIVLLMLAYCCSTASPHSWRRANRHGLQVCWRGCWPDSSPGSSPPT